MKKTAILVMLALLASAPGWAAPYLDVNAAHEITIPDDMASVGFDGGPLGIAGEDNEVEQGCVASQIWDLEAFYLDGSTNLLTMVGGFDFVAGRQGTGQWFDPGHLFIAVNHKPKYGKEAGDISWGDDSGPSSIQQTFGYDFALVFNFTNLTYEAYALDPTDTTLVVWYNQNKRANPWQYASGGDAVSLSDNSFAYETGKFNIDFPVQAGTLLGDTGGKGSHNAVQVNLSWLWGLVDPNDDGLIEIYTHYTYECGNDSMMGWGFLTEDPNAFVPEPASITLMGLGIAVVAVSRMRKKA
ncbi:MAG TPA: PEP-CTERM sorting domain-containing protein [Candidatus Hydrogenedentes bacterium]|nr:PEP-CTERM sorting domain-containing protein [Candidatus Hydrogenedentota bacterium]